MTKPDIFPLHTTQHADLYVMDQATIQEVLLYLFLILSAIKSILWVQVMVQATSG